MRTFEEILKDEFGVHHESGNSFNDEIWNDLKQAAIIYAKKACEKQREICAENAKPSYWMWKTINGERMTYTNTIEVDKDSILNSPEPELI